MQGTFGKHTWEARGSDGQGSKREKGAGSSKSFVPRGLYDVLGVKPGSGKRVLKKAYHALALKVSSLLCDIIRLLYVWN